MCGCEQEQHQEIDAIDLWAIIMAALLVVALFMGVSHIGEKEAPHPVEQAARTSIATPGP